MTRRGSAALALRAAAVYLVVRLALLPVFVVAWHTQGPNRSSYPDAPPGFLTFLALSWDGTWYHQIAENGYPRQLPLDPQSGEVTQNAWAFYPLFPLMSRALVAVRVPYEVASPLLALMAGVVAMIFLAFLVRDAAPGAVRRRPGLPLLAVAALSAFPSGAVGMVGYSETTALLLIVATLYLISRRRYGSGILSVVLLGFARGVALPMTAVVIWHAAARHRRSLQGAEPPLTPLEWTKLAGLTVSCVASGVIWPWICEYATGVPNAYLQTQAAWRLGSVPTTPFGDVIGKLSQWVSGELAWLLVVVTVVTLLALSLTKAARLLGPELQAWGASYLIYIGAVSLLGSPLLRYALLSITLPLAMVAWSRRRWIQVAVLVVMLGLQALWIVNIWVFSGRGDAFPP